jgi:uncharacterized protein (DUF2235 family)
MPRNIVVGCDGTGNQYGAANSNVVKLYWTLSSQDEQPRTTLPFTWSWT